MKKIIFLLLLIFQTVKAQKKDEIIVRFDKVFPGNIYKDTTQQDKIKYFIDYKYNDEYIVLEIINSIERIENKSFLRKANVLEVTEILELGTAETMKLFENKRVYIINPNVYKKNKIVLQEVKISSDFHQM